MNYELRITNYKFRFLVSAFVLAACTLFLLAGCETTAEESRAEAQYRDRLRAGGELPWNRPQSWEGNPFGSSINTR